MKNLLPHFIHDQFEHGQTAGIFKAATMFVDISGFTQLTETAMYMGDEGAEIMSRIFNQNAIVNAIYERNGFIATFAGDAFTAIFPEPVYGLGVLAAALKIRSYFDDRGRRHSLYSDLDLSIKIGLSYGQITWDILGEEFKVYIFRGPAIDSAALAEHQATAKDIILTQSFIAILNPHEIRLSHRQANYFCFQNQEPNPAMIEQPRSSKTILQKPEIGRFFLPEILLQTDQIGEFRNVAAVFLAFRGASTRSQLNRFINHLTQSIFDFGGYLNKVNYGDKGSQALCLFGAPTAYVDNRERAMSFLLDMRARLRQDPDLPTMSIRAGATYGTVYAGLVGGHRRNEYTVIGDRVNLASRLMTTAEYDAFYVDESIYRGTKDYFKFVLRGRKILKGNPAPVVVVYDLSGKKMSRNSASKTFLGRQQETKLLKFLLADSIPNRTIRLRGIYKIGKHSLLNNLQVNDRQARWIFLVKDTNQTPRQIISNAIQRFQFDYHFTRSHWRYFIRHLNLDHEPPPWADRPLLFGHSLAAPHPTNNSGCLAGTIEWLLTALSTKFPIRLVLDADLFDFPDFNNLKSTVLSLPDTHDVKIIQVENISQGLSEAEHSQPSDRCLNLELTGLDFDSLDDFAKQILQERYDPELSQKLAWYIDRHPYLAVHFMPYVQSSDLCRRILLTDGGELVETNINLPTPIVDYFIAQLDGLSLPTKSLLCTAAILGYRFDIKLLYEIMKRLAIGWQTEAVDRHLQLAVQRSVIATHDPEFFQFKIPMFRDIIYRLQLKQRVREIHWIIADTIERDHQSNDHRYFQLAYHYQKAQLLKKSAENFREAIKSSIDRADWERCWEIYYWYLTSRFINKLIDSYLRSECEMNSDHHYIFMSITEIYSLMVKNSKFKNINFDSDQNRVRQLIRKLEKDEMLTQSH